MKAKEIRENSFKSVEKEYNEILKEIKNVADKGELSLYKLGNISPVLIERLKEDGFKIIANTVLGWKLAVKSEVLIEW